MGSLNMYYINIFFISVFNIFFSSYVFSSDYLSEVNLKAKGSPQRGYTNYKGYTYSGTEYAAKVENQVSLGGQYTEKVREAIKNYDEFFVAFMYRFDHPAFIRDLGDKVHLFQKQGPAPVIQDPAPKQPERIKYPPLIFLDYNTFFKKKDYNYKNYVKHLIYNVPVSFVNIGESGYKNSHKAFHHKIIICKEKNKEASVFIGSANATYHADYQHSDDTLLIQSNNLAKNILDEFRKLFYSDIVRIVDIYGFNNNKKHREYLEDFYNIINEEIKLDIKLDIITPSISIKSFVISTGTGDWRKNACLKFFKKNILKEKNNALLIYFQNYLNIYGNSDKEGYFKTLRKSLEEKEEPLKLVVRWDNISTGRKQKNNIKAEELYYNELQNKKDIYFVNFKPYTQSKFHHKAIIQYLKNDEDPILYTGSFNLSVNAIKNNSENIIGVRSKTLVEDYLCSLLWNSNLADQEKIWQFFREGDNMERFSLYNSESTIKDLALKVLSRCKNNIYRCSIILQNNIEQLINNLDEKITVIKILDEYQKILEKNNYNYVFSQIRNTFSQIKNMFLTDKVNIIGDKIKEYISGICDTHIKPKAKYLENKHTVLKLIDKLSLNSFILKEQKYEKWIDVIKEIIENAKIKSYSDIIELYEHDEIALRYGEYDNLENDLEDLKDYLDNIEDIYSSMVSLDLLCSDFDRLSSLYLTLQPFSPEENNDLSKSASGLNKLNCSPPAANKKLLKRVQSSPIRSSPIRPSPVLKKQRKKSNLQSTKSLSEDPDISSTVTPLLNMLQRRAKPLYDSYRSSTVVRRRSNSATEVINRLEKINNNIDIKNLNDSLKNTKINKNIGYHLVQYITQKGRQLIRYEADQRLYDASVSSISEKYSGKNAINEINSLIQEMSYNSGLSIDNENYAKEYLGDLVKQINRFYEAVEGVISENKL